jgi:hypothetical protein
MQPLYATAIRDAIQPTSQILVCTGTGKQATREGSVVQAGAAHHHRDATPSVNLANDSGRITGETGGRIHLCGTSDVDQMMGNA